jgi:hypothetical protein
MTMQHLVELQPGVFALIFAAFDLDIPDANGYIEVDRKLTNRDSRDLCSIPLNLK